MNSTLIFALVIAVESLAVIVVIIGICFLIWGDFPVEADAQVRRTAASPPVKTTPKKATIPGAGPAASAPLKKTASTTAKAAPSAPKVVMTKTAPPSSAGQ